MVKIDELKEEIATKRVFLDKFIIIAIAILTGTVTVIYQVLSSKVPLYMLLVVVVGLVALIINIYVIIRVYEHINSKIKELKNA